MSEEAVGLYHWTCSHGFAAIGPIGVLRPTPQIAMPGCPLLVWMTDMEVADRQALGLQSEVLLKCDRTEHRYLVTDQSKCVRWADWQLRIRLPRDFLSQFTFGRKPMHWWVSEAPVPVVAYRGSNR